MDPSSIDPGKVTRPFQLMAVWFLMLVLVESAFLTAATKIQKPEWAAGFLVVAAFIIFLVVVLIVFAMLTKFRPHLQDGREYSEWLKDERLYKTSSAISDVPVCSAKSTLVLENIADDSKIPQRKKASKFQADVIDIGDAGASKIVEQLQRLGFSANLYKPRYYGGLDSEKRERYEAIWVGANIPPRLVCASIKKSLGIWPHLKYLHLSSDSGGPKFTHNQIFVGGATSAAERLGLKPWTNDELLRISESISLGELHRLIKSKYS